MSKAPILPEAGQDDQEVSTLLNEVKKANKTLSRIASKSRKPAKAKSSINLNASLLSKRLSRIDKYLFKYNNLKNKNTRYGRFLNTLIEVLKIDLPKKAGAVLKEDPERFVEIINSTMRSPAAKAIAMDAAFQEGGNLSEVVKSLPLGERPLFLFKLESITESAVLKKSCALAIVEMYQEALDKNEIYSVACADGHRYSFFPEGDGVLKVLDVMAGAVETKKDAEFSKSLIGNLLEELADEDIPEDEKDSKSRLLNHMKESVGYVPHAQLLIDLSDAILEKGKAYLSAAQKTLDADGAETILNQLWHCNIGKIFAPHTEDFLTSLAMNYWDDKTQSTVDFASEFSVTEESIMMAILEDKNPSTVDKSASDSFKAAVEIMALAPREARKNILTRVEVLVDQVEDSNDLAEESDDILLDAARGLAKVWKFPTVFNKTQRVILVREEQKMMLGLMAAHSKIANSLGELGAKDDLEFVERHAATFKRIAASQEAIVAGTDNCDKIRLTFED